MQNRSAVCLARLVRSREHARRWRVVAAVIFDGDNLRLIEKRASQPRLCSSGYTFFFFLFISGFETKTCERCTPRLLFSLVPELLETKAPLCFCLAAEKNLRSPTRYQI